MGQPARLYFIDALRAFAIVMMLQGHFISGLLDPAFKDPSNAVYSFWLYCRGFTAPVFFTITGWVFTFLLLRNPLQGWKNPRVKKGGKRALELLFWGYVLRLNLPMLLNGQLNNSFLFPDVLQIIGVSLCLTLVIYGCCSPLKRWAGVIFLLLGLLIFLTEPLYVDIVLRDWPQPIAGYLTKANKGVFYLFPWFGYVCMGSCMACLFNSKTEQLWAWALGFLAVGYWLVFKSSAFLIGLEWATGMELFRKVAYNNFLFIRLGDVCLLFGGFMLANDYLKKGGWTNLGSKTLEIYIVHYFILYGSLFGIGLYKYYKYSWTFPQAIGGALLFVVVCSGTVLLDSHFRPKLRTFFATQLAKLK